METYLETRVLSFWGAVEYVWRYDYETGQTDPWRVFFLNVLCLVHRLFYFVSDLQSFKNILQLKAKPFLGMSSFLISSNKINLPCFQDSNRIQKDAVSG